jgi:hypothetical protein
MDNLARALERDGAFLEAGEVTGSEGGLYRVDTGCGTLEARRAVSCLVEPLAGDTVLVSQTNSGGCHVLGILERQADAATSLAFEGDVDLNTRNGRLRVTAQQGIDLVSPEDATLVSRHLQVHAGEGEVNIPQLSFLGSALQAQVETVKLFGKACDSVFERVSQSVRRSFRRVEEMETLSAGQLDYVVKKIMSLRGKHSVLTAEENVRIDGDKILMG